MLDLDLVSKVVVDLLSLLSDYTYTPSGIQLKITLNGF